MNTGNLTAGTKIGYILMGIISAIAGIWLFMYPGLTTGTLGMTLGILFIGYGIVAIISYFGEGPYRKIFKFNLILGILLIIFGICMLMNIQGMMDFLGILTGILLLVDACFRIYVSMIAKGLGVTPWWLVLIMAVLQIVLALMFLFNPSASGEMFTMLVGATFLSQGIMDISIGFFA